MIWGDGGGRVLKKGVLLGIDDRESGLSRDDGRGRLLKECIF